MEKLEAIAQELLDAYDVTILPVPIETILRNPKAGMWDKVDVTQLSGSFLTAKERYSPRMSMARLLARHVALCDWGHQRNIRQQLNDEDQVQAFARMLIMPKQLVLDASDRNRNPTLLSLRFEVPEEDARQRLEDLFA